MFAGGSNGSNCRQVLTLVTLYHRNTEHARKVRVFTQANNPAEEENRKLVEEHGAEVMLGSVTDESIGVRIDEEGEADGLDKAECGMEAYPEFGTGSQRGS